MRTAAASSASYLSWLPLARQTARIRAIASSALVPHERAMADATVLTAWLTTAQRLEYAPTLRAGSDAEEFVARLADERRVVLEEGADTVADEVESAAEAERAARQLPLRLLETLLLLGALTFFVLTIMSMEVTNGLPGVPTSRELWLMGGIVMTAVLAAVVGRVATRRRDRALLSWAVKRPGQLGRGVPVTRALQGESLGPALVATLAPVLLVGIGIVGMFFGAAVLLLELLSRDDASMTTPALFSLVGAALALLLSVVLGRLRGRRLELVARRARAIEWFGPALETPAAGPTSEPSGGVQDIPGLGPRSDASSP